MLTVAVQACGVDASFAIGGNLNESGSNAHAGEGDVFVAEADESDRSFLLLAPYAAIVTNVEADHLDNYGDLAAVEAAFDRFLGTVHADGFVVVCADDPGSARLRGVPTPARLRTYGTAEDADPRPAALAARPAPARGPGAPRGAAPRRRGAGRPPPRGCAPPAPPRTPTCGWSTSTSAPTPPAGRRCSTARSSAGGASAAPASTGPATPPPRSSPAAAAG